jgi:S1-C subfamily serine protease
MTGALKSLSDALAGTVEALGPGVVRVEARRRMPASGVVWSSDGLVVTAHHAVEFEEEISLGLADGRTVNAELVGRDPTTDLALLRAEGSLEAPKWRGPEDLRVGHLVLALARPGRTVQATLGIVSALAEAWQSPGGGQVDRFLQTDVVMAPGFSGGPLVGAGGEVHGVNTSGLLRGLSMALPTPTVERVAAGLAAHGRIRRGYLGIGAQSVQLPAGLEAQLGQSAGQLLLSVEPGGPADSAGFILGDVLVAFEGTPIQRMDDLVALLTGDRVGQTATVRLVRGGTVQERSIIVGERPR